METKTLRNQTGVICIFFMILLCAEVVFSFMRFGVESRDKWYIDQNQKVAISMYDAIQQAATTYSEVTTKLIPSVLERTFMVRCKNYKDLAKAKSHTITQEFPPLKEPPSSAFVSFATIAVTHSAAQPSKADGTVKGEKVQFLMKAIDDQSEGLMIQLQTQKIVTWEGDVCYMMSGSKKTTPAPAPTPKPKKNRRLGKRSLLG
jgi:hypothetical protein